MFPHQGLSFRLCSVHQVAKLAFGLHMDVRWLQDISYLFTCGSLYNASSKWLVSNAE